MIDDAVLFVVFTRVRKGDSFMETRIIEEDQGT